jgi:outer membrane protein OmpA-like peptidoglycan-associated protein
MSTTQERVKTSRAGLWALLALLILMLLCLWVHGRSIPTDIAGRVRAALEAAGMPAGLAFRIEGRDLVLSGEIEPTVDRRGLVDMLQSIRGVRSVRDSLSVAALEPARFSLRVSGSQAEIGGLLPGRQGAALLEGKAAALVGEGKLSGGIDTRPRVQAPAWLDALSALIPELKGAAAAGIEAGPGGLILTGRVGSAEERDRIGEKAQALFAGLLSVDNRLQVVPPKPPARLKLLAGAGTVALSGELSEPAQIDRLLAAVRAAFGNLKISNSLAADGSVGEPAWLDAVLTLMPELASVDKAGLEADANGIALSGSVSSQELREAIVQKAKTTLGDLALVNRITVVKPATVAAPPPAPPPEVNFPTLHFLHDSTELKAESKGLLEAAAEALLARPDLHIELAGFTDSSGEEAYNRDLSRRRAEEVLNYLVSKGIASGRLTAEGYGESQPIGDNLTEEGRAMNRRVEFRIQQ